MSRELKCFCGGELTLSVGFDGDSQVAEMHHKSSGNWGTVVALECQECGEVFEVCRTQKYENISGICGMYERKNETH